MADLVVEFSRYIPGAPIEEGDAVTVEVLEIGGTADTTAHAAGSDENVVDLHAGADCWIAIGSAPVAEAEAGRWMSAGERRQFRIKTGHRVAVIDASA